MHKKESPHRGEAARGGVKIVAGQQRNAHKIYLSPCETVNNYCAYMHGPTTKRREGFCQFTGEDTDGPCPVWLLEGAA